MYWKRIPNLKATNHVALFLSKLGSFYDLHWEAGMSWQRLNPLTCLAPMACEQPLYLSSSIAPSPSIHPTHPPILIPLSSCSLMKWSELSCVMSFVFSCMVLTIACEIYLPFSGDSGVVSMAALPGEAVPVHHHSHIVLLYEARLVEHRTIASTRRRGLIPTYTRLHIYKNSMHLLYLMHLLISPDRSICWVASIIIFSIDYRIAEWPL